MHDRYQAERNGVVETLLRYMNDLLEKQEDHKQDRQRRQEARGESVGSQIPL